MQLFFELIQVALGQRDDLSRNPSIEEWNALFLMCKQQAVAGVAFPALEKLNNHGKKPSLSILYDWIGLNGQIKQQNQVVNATCVKLAEDFRQEGYDSCILKGQGNNLLYPLPYSRTPGDIDIWITPNDKSITEKERHQRVLHFIRKKYPNGNLHYNHIDAGEYDGIRVEVHHRPRFLNNTIHNYKLQKWIQEKREEQFEHLVCLPKCNQQIAIPTIEFNLIFQLAHIYSHVLQSGIGMRQIVDYFYLLKSDGRGKMDDVSNTLRHLGLEKIAEAVMWVLHEKLGLPEEYLIAPIDERRGKILLSEIMRGGNFGYYDSENVKATSRLKKNVQRVKRDLRLMRFFPSECLWEPVFRVYHLFWRMAH